MKLTIFFDSKAKLIYLKSLIVYERKLKIKVTSHYLLTSVANFKQIILHEKKIVQYFYN